MVKNLLIICVFFVTTSFAHAQTPEPDTPQKVEETVREYFVETPVLIDIARCESKFRQFTDAGNVFYGDYGNQMVGVFQFYESIHQPVAQDLGFDLDQLQGNIEYAEHLYNESGTTPWKSSRHCWYSSPASSSNIVSAPTTASLTEQEMLKKIDLLQQIIKLLQTLQALK